MNAAMRLAAWLVPSRGVREDVNAHVDAWVYGGGEESGPKRPALLWLHGGGYVIGHARMDEPFLLRCADELDLVVASVNYRLATQHPFPTPVEDAYAALRWLAARPDVDPARIAIGGASAGAGLAASLAQLARERGEVTPSFQLLVYPMLDDRSAGLTGPHDVDFRLWNRTANRYGWRTYLGGADLASLPHWAVPGRTADLSGLPPAWIGVGTLDLFHDEDVAYAERLREADVPCALEVVPGAYHGFDAVEFGTPVVQAFDAAKLAALRSALGAGHGGRRAT